MIRKRIQYYLAHRPQQQVVSASVRQKRRFILLLSEQPISHRGRRQTLKTYTLHENDKEIARIALADNFVCNLAVNPEFRGEGWSRYMMKTLLSQTSGPLTIEARPFGQQQTMTAHQLADYYSQFGFVPWSEDNQPRPDAVFMSRKSP